VRVRPCARDRLRAFAASDCSPSSSWTIRAGAVGVIDRELALEARADDRHVLAALGSPGDRVEVEAGSPSRTWSEREAVSRIAAVPFVVEKMTVGARGSPGTLAGDAPTSKPSIRTASAQPPEQALPQALTQRTGFSTSRQQ
jgi:hypothetical protein